MTKPTLVHYTEATVEEMISTLTWYEDIDTALIIMAADHRGNMLVQGYDGQEYKTGRTLREALIAYGRNIERLRHDDVYDFPVSKDYPRIVDWRDRD